MKMTLKGGAAVDPDSGKPLRLRLRSTLTNHLLEMSKAVSNITNHLLRDVKGSRLGNAIVPCPDSMCIFKLHSSFLQFFK